MNLGLLALVLPKEKRYSMCMRMFKSFILSAILFFVASSLHAQIIGLVAKTQRAVAQQTLHSVSAVSRQANRAVYKRLSVLFKPRTTLRTPPIHQLPKSGQPITFRVHEGKLPVATASAFAIEKNGRLLGVTAAHVMENIEQEPYMTVQTKPEEFKSIPISVWRKGHPYNIDVAIFEIPEEAQPYVKPLPLSEQPLKAKQSVSITGFSYNLPLWFPQEEVAFVGKQRIFIHSSSDKPFIGMCGSPVMVNEKVAGIYAGFTDEADNTPRWMRLLEAVSANPLPPVHQAIPIDQITPFVQSLTDGTPEPESILLKVLGHPVTLLGQEDFLYSIDLIRKGDLIQSIYTGPLADPEHLELFLNVQDGDDLVLSILRKDGDYQVYRVDASSGKTTQEL